LKTYYRRQKTTAVPNKNTFQCANGDTLLFLNDALKHIEHLLQKSIERLRVEEAKVKPFQQEVDLNECFANNIRCRLNIWWDEYKDAGGK